VFDASNYWITVVELPSFEEAAAGVLTDEEREGVIAYVAQKPDDGEIIPDTGGLRWLKWPACRPSGFKVVYYFRDLNMPAYLLAVLNPGERLRFTKTERAKMREVVDQLVDEQWKSQVTPLLAAVLRPGA
jgi:hypothetical protein